MITPDGWFDFAIRKPGPAHKVNGGRNSAIGIFCHSAEGYANGLWSQLTNAPVSWHLSNLFDGSLYQHYPLTAQCWHATAANNHFIGMEHEGRVPNEPTLTDAQVVTTRRVIAELAAWKGWTPSRPTGPTDTTHTLWEHREVVRLGGTSSSCPSGRIPWDKILEDEDEMKRHNALSEYFAGKQLAGDHPMDCRADFGLPTDAKRCRLEIYLDEGIVTVKDADGKYAGQVGWDGARYGIVDADVDLIFEGSCKFAQVGTVGYW